jgi:hypothetical protein
LELFVHFACFSDHSQQGKVAAAAEAGLAIGNDSTLYPTWVQSTS